MRWTDWFCTFRNSSYERCGVFGHGRDATMTPARTRGPTEGTREIRDRLARPLHDLRISITDRCNFRCTYCMPKEQFGAGYRFMHRSDLLSFEEIARLAGLFAGHGVRKIRLTGGEPLLRQGLEDLVRMLSAVEGITDLTLTTNGSLLTSERARALRESGLARLTVSLDAIDDTVFSSMNDMGFPVGPVLQAIEHAGGAGLSPVKINMVVKRGVNDHEVVPMAERFRGTGHIVRFIEFMDVGTTNGWRLDDVVPAREIVDMIGRVHPLRPADPNYRGEVARRWRYADGAGEIGVIASVTQPFCGACSRARLSAEGKLYTCLFASDGFDLRSLVRSGASDEALSEAIGSIWGRRDDRYSELRASHTPAERRIEMSYIGG